MISLQELKKKTPVFLNNFSSLEEIIREFEAEWDEEKIEELKNTKYKDINILFASYGTGHYSGDAYVLFEKNDELYEVMGSHCSCYGLEGQFEYNKPSNLEGIKYIIESNKEFGVDEWSDNNFREELIKFLEL